MNKKGFSVTVLFICVSFLAFVFCLKSEQPAVVKEGKKQVKISTSKLRERCCVLVADVLKKIRHMRRTLDELEDDLFATLCDFFSNDSMGTLATGEREQLLEIEKALLALQVVLDEPALREKITSVHKEISKKDSSNDG